MLKQKNNINIKNFKTCIFAIVKQASIGVKIQYQTQEASNQFTSKLKIKRFNGRSQHE